MEKAVALVLYPQKMEGFLSSLVSTLQQAADPVLTVVQARLEGSLTEPRDLAKAMEAHSAEVIFVGLDLGASDLADQLVRSFNGVPVIGVIDEAGAGDPGALARCGVADFVSPPSELSMSFPACFAS